MTKIHWHSFTLGVVVSVLTMSLFVPAVAAVTGQTAFNTVNIVVNGQQVSASGADYDTGNGKMAPSSITFTNSDGGGTVYLPVRRVSELLNIPIEWNGTTNSVEIGQSTAAIPQPTPAPASGVTFYAECPSVPDFGAYAEIPLITSYCSEEGDVFIYAYDLLDMGMAAERKNSALIPEYEDMLLEQGFVYDSILTSEINKDGHESALWYTNVETEMAVVLEISDDPYACYIIIMV